MANKGNNYVFLVGKVVSHFLFSHETYGEGFYTVDLMVKCLNGAKDVISLIVSDRLINTTENHEGKCIGIQGQLRSYNRYENNQKRRIASIFVQSIFFDTNEDDVKNPNQIYLDGVVYRVPVYILTQSGRELTELYIAVKRSYGKIDYIPCICWEQNARYASVFKEGSHVRLWGEIQSYNIQDSGCFVEFKNSTEYIVSVDKLEEVIS